MSRLRYVTFRMAFTVLLILLVASGLFLLFRLMPGSFADIFISQGANPEQVERLRAHWGLDEPLYVQYAKYIINLLSGDVGQSFVYNKSVWVLVEPRLINTFVLVAPAITLSYLLGGILGGIMGQNRGHPFEKGGIISVSIAKTVPEFFTAMILIVVFSLWFKLFPSGGMLSSETALALADKPFYAMFWTGDFWHHYILPFATITIYFLTFPTLIMRNNVVEVEGEDFIYYHRIKGLPRRVLLRKLIKHASLPVITMYPITMTRALGGVVLIEIVFSWPGIGKFLVDSVLAHDFPVIQFVFLLIAIWIILGNFLVDIVYGIIDPRVAIGGSEE